MGNSADWQQKVIDDFQSFYNEKEIVVLNPRRTNWDSSWIQSIENKQFNDQVNWELDALEKSDFIRLNTARIGYNFDLKGLNWINGLTLYITGQNLLTITNYTGYDPLINSPKSNGGNQSIGIDYASYPTSRTFSFGATLKL